MKKESELLTKDEAKTLYQLLCKTNVYVSFSNKYLCLYSDCLDDGINIDLQHLDISSLEDLLK